MMDAPIDDLDRWLEDPAVRTRHRREAAATADALWAAAASLRLDETRTLGRLVRWRLPGLRKDLTFLDLFSHEPFVVLDHGERWSLSGLAGRIWTLDDDYARLDGPAAFRAWDEPGTVRVLFAHWVLPAGHGRAALHSEARVEPVDRGAHLRLRGLWTVVGVFERLIGAEPLTLAARRAEGRPTGEAAAVRR